MNPMRKVSAAVLIAAIFAGPVVTMAATGDTAKVTMAGKADIPPVANLTPMIGHWAPTDLAFLDKASAVTVFDTRTLYPAADLQKIASAETANSAGLVKFRDAIRADSALDAWFVSNKFNVGDVVAIADPNGKPQVFLY